MEDLYIEHLVTSEETGEPVWTVYKYPFNPNEDFKIDPENIDGEICGIGLLINKYGDAHSKLEAQVERHKREVDFIYADLLLKYRTELVKANEKTTSEILKSHVIIDDYYQLVVSKYIESQRQFNLIDAWWKNILKKADLLQSLAYKLSSEIKRGAF